MTTATLTALSPAQCLQLLRTADVGRIVHTSHSLPAIAPVNYALDGDAIIFRTAAGSGLATATDGSVVAFEVDELDPIQRSGWSVVVLGMADLVREASQVLRMQQLNLISWAPGPREQFVRIVPAQLTGRRLVGP